jgi:hypothetical protein
MVLTLVICLAVAVLAAGCDKPKYNISGKVTRDGKPLEWKGDNIKLDVKFVPLDRDRDKKVYSAQETDGKAGTYSISGIPPGTYLVSIQQMDPFPTHDLLNFTLDMAKSPLRATVTKDGEVIDLDIPKDLAKARKDD